MSQFVCASLELVNAHKAVASEDVESGCSSCSTSACCKQPGWFEAAVQPRSSPQQLLFLHAVQNPFGDAKPREAVLASRTGKTETEILVEEVKAEKPKVCHCAQVVQ